MADLGSISSLLSAAGVGGLIAKAVVQLELETGKYQAELKGAQAQTVSGANTMGASVSKFGGLAQTAMLGAAAGAVAFGASSVKAFIDAQKVMAQTEAVLKSTGGAAHVTADDVVVLAETLRDLSGVDDEVIQASENLLLTFRDIRNEAGAGNDIFSQTEKAILDMATAMNEGAVPSMEDLHSTTIQVGKALNNPIQGMTALRRVGVSFTEAQVAVITRLQESGDLMGAQKIILEELSAEFGGAAEAAGDTFAGQMAKLSSRIGDVQEDLGEALMPAIEGLVGALEGLLPLLERVAQAMQFLPLVQMGEDFDSNASGIVKFGDALLDTIPVLGHFVNLAGDESDALGRSGEAATKHLSIITELSEFYRDRFNAAIDSGASHVKRFAKLTADELSVWADDVKGSFDEAIVALEDLSTESGVTREDFINASQRMKQEAIRLARAMNDISKEKWINDEYIKFLSEQGPEWMIGFASLTREQQQKAQDAWQTTREKTDSAKESLDKITGVLDKLDRGESKHKVTIEYQYVGFDPTKPGMNHSRT